MSLNKVFILIIFLLLYCKVAFTKNYYFADSRGNDSYTSTQAQSPLTPWKSLTKLNDFFPNINPGDSILLNRGDIFRGSIIVTKSGTNSLPITIGTYGVGALPIITLTTITGWTQNSNGVFSIKKQMWPEISIFYQDGKPLLQTASSSNCTDGNWWCDNSNLYYKPAIGTANDHVITIANIGSNSGYESGIDLSNSSYITINGIEFDAIGYALKTFDTKYGTVGLTIQNSVFNYCRTAIYFMPDIGNNTTATIKNCLFYRNQCAINMYTSSGEGGRPGQTHGTHINCNITGNEMAENGTIDGTTHWFRGTDFEAIGLQNFMNGTITNNYVHDGFQIGIIFYNLDTRSSDNNVISQNRIINNKKGGLILQGDNCDEGYSADYSFNNNFISNNLFVNSSYTATSSAGTIIIYPGKNTTQMNYFVNNTLSGNSNVIYFPTSRPPFFTIENNIIYNSGAYRFVEWTWLTKPQSLIMDYNLYFEENSGSYGFQFRNSLSINSMRNLGMEEHSKFLNPFFINASAIDFNLQSTSPAIDAGVKVGLPYIGNAPDIGAYEFSDTICKLNKPSINKAQ